MISVKLLSALLNKDITKFAIRGNNLIPISKSPTHKDLDINNTPINIYELSFNLCIEWAFLNHYYVNIDKTACEVWKDNILVHTATIDLKPKDSKSYMALIKACEWILESLKESDDNNKEN